MVPWHAAHHRHHCGAPAPLLVRIRMGGVVWSGVEWGEWVGLSPPSFLFSRCCSLICHSYSCVSMITHSELVESFQAPNMPGGPSKLTKVRRCGPTCACLHACVHISVDRELHASPPQLRCTVCTVLGCKGVAEALSPGPKSRVLGKPNRF